MPKKSATARSGAQRQRPRTQKSFELVRPTTAETENTAITADTMQNEESSGQSVATMTATARTVENEPEQDALAADDDASDEIVSAPVPAPPTPLTRKTVSKNVPVSLSVPTSSVPTPTAAPTTTRSGASARFAARRQAQQKAQQKSTASLVTTEHFAYVRHDLMIIAILAIIMFAAIIFLYFTIGR